jgi:hypothetical protein
MPEYTPLDSVELKHALAGMAEALAAYVADLQAHGFTRDEALTLAIAWQRDVITRPSD